MWSGSKPPSSSSLPERTLHTSCTPPRAFARTVLPRTAVSYVYFVRLRHGAGELPRFSSQVNTLNSHWTWGPVRWATRVKTRKSMSVEASIHPQAIGWWILAALAALVGLAVVGQALARQSIVESEDYPTMAALGADRRQLVALGMARNLVVALAGAAGAVAVAIALSPIAPLGEARIAETSTGVTFDTLVLPLGALATVAVVLALGLWPAVRAAHTLRTDDRAVASRPSAVVAHLAATGAPPSAVIGVRNALERRSGGASVPVGSALLGTVLAVTRAVRDGGLRRQPFAPHCHAQAVRRPVPAQFQPERRAARPHPPREPRAQQRRHRDHAGAPAAESSRSTRWSSWTLAASPVRGPLLFSTVDGHLPSGSDQIGLGATTMRQVGAHLGSVVQVTVSKGARKTNRAVPGGLSGLLPGAAAGGIEPGHRRVDHDRWPRSASLPSGSRASSVPTRGSRARATEGSWPVSCPGPGGRRRSTTISTSTRRSPHFPITPTSLVNFGEAVNFPLIFGAMLAVFGAATLAHLLVVSVSRRRREIGLLKVLGFVNRQVASAVAWQATTLGRCRDRHRRPARAGGRPGGVEGVRQQPGCRPGLRRPRSGSSACWWRASSSSPTSSPSHRRWWRHGPSREISCERPEWVEPTRGRQHDRYRHPLLRRHPDETRKKSRF